MTRAEMNSRLSWKSLCTASKYGLSADSMAVASPEEQDHRENHKRKRR
jgi:hypothetical protein